MKRVFFILSLLTTATLLWAQPHTAEEKTILYLIPFYSHGYDAQSLSDIKSCDDLKTVNAFQLMGFWAGAQIALEEFAEQNVRLNVIVRDITDSETKLRKLMENSELMEKVDLIVGPFFSKQFAIAAKYAQKYKIPIINPFTNRSDIVEDNEYVYKLIPSLETQPGIVSFVSDMRPNSQIILYADTLKKSKEYNTYVKYFKNNKIKYKTVPLHNNIVPSLNTNGQNVVVAMTNESAKMMMMSRDLIFESDLDNLLLIVPEEWLNVATYDIEYYSKLNIHYFSDYYVDFKSEAAQVFIHKYTEKFKTPPTLESFAFQGYDVTRYFVSALFNDMDLDRVKVSTVGFHLGFDKIENGGYENINTNFLEVKDNIIRPAEF